MDCMDWAEKMNEHFYVLKKISQTVMESDTSRGSLAGFVRCPQSQSKKLSPLFHSLEFTMTELDQKYKQ